MTGIERLIQEHTIARDKLQESFDGMCDEDVAATNALVSAHNTKLKKLKYQKSVRAKK